MAAWLLDLNLETMIRSLTECLPPPHLPDSIPLRAQEKQIVDKELRQHIGVFERISEDFQNK